MKKLITLFSLILFLQVFSQNKDLTINDAVLGYYKGLYPQSMPSLQFVDDNHYIYREDSDYIIKNIETNTSEKITLRNIQNNFPEIERLPRIVSIDSNNVRFNLENSIVTFDYKNNKKVNQIFYDKKAQNTDYNKKNIAYTIDNNLYIATIDNPKIAVTNFTDKNIVAGQAIARYEFGISKGTFWSPNGNYLAFYQKDEANVTNYPLIDDTTYPATVNNIKYPMAGQGSEIAKIGIYDVVKNKVTYLNIDTSDEHYLTNLTWSPDEKLILVAEVNRAQNHYALNTYKIKNGEKAKTILEESNERWVEPENDAIFLPNSNTEFLWLSEKEGYKNLYLYNTKGRFKRKVSTFNFVIKSVLGFDKSGNNVLVIATGKDGKDTHVYKVNIQYGETTKITSKNGTHRTQLKGEYLIDDFSSISTPREISIINFEEIEENTIFSAKNPLQDYKLGTTSFVTLKSKDGHDLYGRIITPPNFNPTKKYPVLVYVYGGTHAQLVTNSWLGGASLWMHWLATQKDYIVFTLDNRGSGNRGFDFESVIHRQAGEAAMEDQLIGVKYLTDFYNADPNRIAVHGWSYGGFMASSLTLRNPGVFTTAVAGGPVTDWKYYEVMYGERYMDTPQENPKGYAKSRVGQYLENLKGKLLLIHGSVDPTVVPQHSMTFLKEAVDKNVQVDFFTYPMHEHNVRGKDRVHLMTKILNYITINNK